MKKWLCMLVALLMFVPALAEEVALPVRLLEHEEAAVPLTDALTTARAGVENMPQQSVIRAELAELSDGKKAWVVTIFDSASFNGGWCIMVDAATGAVLSQEAAQDGFFAQAYNTWTAQKGIQALWSMEDKALFDALYAMLPRYGLPIAAMPDGNALTRALEAVGLKSAEGYEVGYGYLMGGEGYNGVWEICLVIDGQVDCRVNLDAVTGEVYYMETNLQDADEANG